MKPLQFFVINALTLLIGLALMSSSFTENKAHASATEVVPKIQIQNLGNYRGQHLTVLYAVGTRPFLSTDSRQVTLSEVKGIRTEVITADSVTLPPMELQKQGFRPGYNIVLIAVSPQPNYVFVNANGNEIAGMPKTSNQQATLLRAFSKSEIESMATPQGLVVTLE